MTENNKLSKTDEEWKKVLTPEQYRVCRKKETERPFTDMVEADISLLI